MDSSPETDGGVGETSLAGRVERHDDGTATYTVVPHDGVDAASTSRWISVPADAVLDVEEMR